MFGELKISKTLPKLAESARVSKYSPKNFKYKVEKNIMAAE